MKFLGSSIPVFVGQAGVGQNFGQIAPQVQFFDVFYTNPPVVGFHVVGSVDDE